jgi:hypothetical protein
MEEQTAWNVIVDYENTRNRFSKMGVNDDISYLEVYARAGAGSFITDRSLNKIMEFEKKRMLKELIEDLRKKTGDDLGEDPNAWIKKYGSGSTNTTR